MIGVLSLGSGRLSGACVIGNECSIVVRRGGALHRLRLTSDNRVLDGGIIGYEKERFEFPEGTLIYDKEARFDVRH